MKSVQVEAGGVGTHACGADPYTVSVSGRFPSYISPDEHGGSLEVGSVICGQESPRKVMKRAYPCVSVAAFSETVGVGSAGSE